MLYIDNWHHHHMITLGYLCGYFISFLIIASFNRIPKFGAERVYFETSITLHLDLQT